MNPQPHETAADNRSLFRWFTHTHTESRQRRRHAGEHTNTWVRRGEKRFLLRRRRKGRFLLLRLIAFDRLRWVMCQPPGRCLSPLCKSERWRKQNSNRVNLCMRRQCLWKPFYAQQTDRISSRKQSFWRRHGKRDGIMRSADASWDGDKEGKKLFILWRLLRGWNYACHPGLLAK